jgi:hypothetical protein
MAKAAYQWRQSKWRNENENRNNGNENINGIKTAKIISIGNGEMSRNNGVSAWRNGNDEINNGNNGEK